MMEFTLLFDERPIAIKVVVGPPVCSMREVASVVMT